MENNKYELFIKLLEFNTDKYSAEQVFKDFISLFAISLSNKVCFNQKNSDMYDEIYQKYDREGQINFYSLAAEITKLFCNEKDPCDILGEIYKKISNQNNGIRLVCNNTQDTVGSKLQNIMKINKQAHNGKMIENNCGSGMRILAYASTLKIFKLDYKLDLEVTAIDTNILNVFMTYIQLYFYEISAVVILLDKASNKEIMRLYTPFYEDDAESLMAA